jgi:DNA-binding MarR family transcriptional regulator
MIRLPSDLFGERGDDMTASDDPFVRLDGALEEVRRRLRVRLRRELRRRGEYVGGGFPILAQLAGSGPSSPSELADQLEVRTSTMAAHLDRLEEAGYIRRAPRDGGGGRVAVHLTDAGAGALARYVALRREVLREVLAALAPDEVGGLARLLERALGSRREGEEG